MATYVLEVDRACELCRGCVECEGLKDSGTVWHVVRDDNAGLTLCIDCLRERGLLW